jgi:N-methylhydantoinase A
MHAAALAKELGIKKVIIPKQSGVFSAWGMLLSDLRRDYLLTQIEDMTVADAAQCMGDMLAELEEKAYREFEAENIDRSRVRFQRYGRCRYQNQEHSTEIDLPAGQITQKRMAEILEHFHANYEREYTYRLAAPVELVTYHLIAIAEVDKLQPEKAPSSGRPASAAVKGQREVDYADAGVHVASLYDGDLLEPGMAFAGPAIIEESGTTVVIPPGVDCKIDDYGNYRLATAQ